VNVLAQTPPELEINAFPSGARIAVPASSLSVYKSAFGWKNYSTQLEAQ
jgi:hypothetical protein